MKTNETTIKERPILFSGAMVRALRDGSKTQTRRLVKPQPPGELWGRVSASSDGSNIGKFMFREQHEFIGSLVEYFSCPYGQPGDRLWVRETFLHTGTRLLAATGQPGYVYRAESNQLEGWDGQWKPSIFMPRAASRLLLEIVSVRVERLQEISEADAKAEGCQIGIAPGATRSALPCVNCQRNQRDHSGVAFACNGTAGVFCPNTYQGGYAMLWEAINGPDSWAANPWGWVVEFKVIDGKEVTNG